MSPTKELKKLLLASGLSENEIILYLELLRQPAENIWQLLNRTKLSKSTTYRAFEKLQNLKLAKKENGQIKAASLRSLITELKTSQRNLGKLAYKIQKISPFLKFPSEAIETFDQLYTKNQIIEAYIFMAEQNFNVSLDFGDFENFVSLLNNDLSYTYKFRNLRIKKGAINKAICTNAGPITALFCTSEAKNKYKNFVERSSLNFKNRFIVFSDTNDYALFNNFEDFENPSSVLVKSKTIADIQRLQFLNISQEFEKI